MSLHGEIQLKTVCTFDLVSTHDAVGINALCAGEPPKIWSREADNTGHFYLLESGLGILSQFLSLHMHRDGGVKLCSGFGFVFGSVDRPDHHAHSFHGVETSSVVSPEDAILELVSIYATRVPDTIEIGLATCIVPPSTFMEVSTVTCSKVRQDKERKKWVRQLVLWTWILQFCTMTVETYNI